MSIHVTQTAGAEPLRAFYKRGVYISALTINCNVPALHGLIKLWSAYLPFFSLVLYVQSLRIDES